MHRNTLTLIVLLSFTASLGFTAIAKAEPATIVEQGKKKKKGSDDGEYRPDVVRQSDDKDKKGSGSGG